MTGSVSYSSDNILVCGNSTGYFTKLEFAVQSLSSWGVDTTTVTGGLPAVSFTAGLTSISEFPFSLPEISVDASPEAGLLTYGSLSLEASNESISGIRVYSLLRDYDTDTEALHVRFSYKTSVTGSWIYRYWGIVDPKSIEVKCSNLTASDTYIVRFSVTNNIQLLENRSIQQFAEDKNKHALNDYIANKKYISVIGSNWRGYSPGRYILRRYFFNNDYDGTSSIGWLPAYDGYTYASDSSREIPLRWYKITDIFKKASEYLGLEASVNDGKPWYECVTSQYGYNTGDDTTNLVFASFDLLMYPVGMYTLSNGSYVYGNVYGYWDETEHAPYSFYQYSNVLELIKGICQSFGLLASVEINSSGQRYLKVVEAGYYDTTAVVIDSFKDDEDNIASDISFEPYFRKTTGVTVVPAIDSSVIRGYESNDSVSIDGIFGSTNFVIISDVSYVNTTSNYLDTREDFRLLGTLWTSPQIASATGSWDGTEGSAKVCEEIYSICAIVPKQMSVASSLSGSLYDFTVKNSNAAVPYGEYQSTYGGYSINGVMYPAVTLGVVNTFTELPQMALAHYYFSPLNASRDELGIYRKKSRALRMKVSGIHPAITINQKLVIKVEDTYTDWYVSSIKENYQDFVTEYTLESRES